MQILSGILVGLLGVAVCQSSRMELTGSTETAGDDTGASTQTGDTGSGLCMSGDFEILGICYHQNEIPNILSARYVTSGDFDGNQALDLAMTCRGTSEPFGICFLSLDGNVIKHDIDWLSSGDARVHAGDFNDDGVDDVLVSEMYRFAVFSLDQGAFVQLNSSVYDGDVHDIEDSLMFPAIPIDLDQDGRAEVVAGSGFAGIRVWQFDALNSEWLPSGERHGLFGCGDLADARVVDLDDDATPELLTLGSHNNCDANMSPGSNWNRISVFTRKPNALELDPAVDFAAELAAQRFDIADFNNGDNAPDLIVTSATDMMLFLGNGDKTFDPPTPIPDLARFVGTGPHAADFNGDDIDELVVEHDAAAYHVLVGLPSPQILTLPTSITAVRLVVDLNEDGHDDIVSLSASGDYPLIISLSTP